MPEPAPGEGKPPMLATVSTHCDEAGAMVARSLLDHHGIPAFLFDDRYGHMNWFALLALGGIRVMVPARDFDVASRLLSDLSAKINVPEDEHCPACGSDDIFQPASWILLLLTVWPLFVPLLVKSRRRHCRSCRHNWRGEAGFLV